MEIRAAQSGDLLGVAAVFHAAFPESIAHIYGHGRQPLPALTASLFAVCLASEPEGFWVAVVDGRVAGYIFAPIHLSRVWKVALARGDVFRWAWGWLCGQYGLGFRPIGLVLANKLSFFRHAVADQEKADARILSVAVHPAAQGRGIARHLCTLAMARFDAAGVERSRLEVRPSNVPAVKIYTDLGFRQVGMMTDSQGDWAVMIRNRVGAS